MRKFCVGVICISLVVLTSFVAPPCFAVGFSKGDIFKSTLVSGTVQMTCESPSEFRTRTFRCYDNLLLPGSFDHFQGPFGVEADEVVLTAKHVDGTSKTKSARYHSETQTSVTRFNLWNLSLTQTPLLMDGENQITYQLKDRGREVTRGQFKVQVEKNVSFVCPRTGQYHSEVLDDCDNQALACRLLFDENKSCLP